MLKDNILIQVKSVIVQMYSLHLIKDFSQTDRDNDAYLVSLSQLSHLFSLSVMLFSSLSN